MAAKDMMDAFQNPHPGVPFACVGDDTIAALANLAAIFKLKLQHAPSPETRASSAKVITCPILIPSPTQILNSPIPIRRQTRSQTTIHTKNIPDVPLPPRVVTPRSLRASPPRVPNSSQRISPHNLSQDDFCGMDSAHMAIALVNHHWSQRHQSNAVIHPVTGKEMEYSALMKYPRLQPLWTRGRSLPRPYLPVPLLKVPETRMRWRLCPKVNLGPIWLNYCGSFYRTRRPRW
jgi:hypothetical protein